MRCVINLQREFAKRSVNVRQLGLAGCYLLLLVMAITAGCEGESLVRVPTDDSEFSTPADYADYDHEMRMLAAGQTDSLSDQYRQPENAEANR